MSEQADMDALHRCLKRERPLAVAVSGGVDSMTLALLAHRLLPGEVEMFHAVSPAVPQEASQRVRDHAAREGWRLHVVDGGEFEDPSYLSNPLNRCFYCKAHLYGAIAAHTTARIVSGANLDDLGEFRPGLDAARAHKVRHPYVEASLTKAKVRAIARALGADDLSELPAAPCLASRIETGLSIRADELARVHAAEQAVGRRVVASTVRCRVRAEAVVVELDEASLSRLTAAEAEAIRKDVAAIFEQDGGPPVRLDIYRVGSAFVEKSHG